jgi:release factor glutamine methyltransferase
MDPAAAATPETWTIARVLAWAAADLKARGSPSPRLDAELLLAHVLGCDRVRLVLDAAQPLEPGQLAAYRELHKRRRAGEPVAYLRGQREFYGRPFVVDARVLVPRPETETLVEVGLRRTRGLSLSARVLDLCTGSGCVAITLKKERPTTTVFASDVSEAALEVARANALRLGALIALCRGDLFAAVASAARFDLVTANPPYIDDATMPTLARDIRDFEPMLALGAGPDALSITRRIVREAPAHLAPGGVLALETTPDAATELADVMAQAGFGAVETARDHTGRARVVSGVCA